MSDLTHDSQYSRISLKDVDSLKSGELLNYTAVSFSFVFAFLQALTSVSARYHSLRPCRWSMVVRLIMES